MRQDKTTPQVDEAVIAEALRTSIPTARCVISDLEDAGFVIMRKPRGDLAAISEAVRTGDWSRVSEWDWKAWLAAVHVGFITEVKPTLGRVVVLDEAGERKIQDLLAGKSVPTGRLVEVTYRMPNGTTKTVRHAEFGKLDRVSYDPLPPVGASIEGATVLGARSTVKLQPGRRVGVGVHDREGAEGAEVLGVFWTDGVISFSGDIDKMQEFKAQLARLAAMPVKGATT